MKNLLKLLFLFVLSCVCSSSSYAQVAAPSSTVIPPSPNAASLGKYAEMPVSLYTGIPNINVPLYTIQQGDLNVPISLSYNSGGIKVEEVSSWVGLGWSLNAGGVVTRTVRGTADELALGSYLNNNITFNVLSNQYKNNPSNFLKTFLVDYEAGVVDTEQDSYYFNVGGMSGKFFIDKSTKKCITVPFQDVKITYTVENTKGFVRWTIITPNGTKYVFGSNLEGTRKAIESNDGTFVYTGASSSHSGAKFNSSWFLIEIISPNHQKIELHYKTNVINYTQRSTQNAYDLVETYGLEPAIPVSDQTYSATNIKGVRLDRIEGSFGKVLFTPAPFGRNDLTTPDSALQFIKIYDFKNVFLKKYRFATSYFISNEPLPASPNLFSSADQLRLRLDSVIELSNENLRKDVYTFTYNENMSLPSRFSYNQDHWGFFNGKSNSSLIPPSASGTNAFIGADRTADFASMKAFSLKKIKFPTGGSQTFNYEANDAYMQDFQNEAVALGDSTYAKINSLNPVVDGRSRSVNSPTFNVSSSSTFRFYLQHNLDSATVNLIQLKVGMINLDNSIIYPFDPIQGINPMLGYSIPPGNYQLYISWKNWIPLSDTLTKVNVYFMASGRNSIPIGSTTPNYVYKNKVLGGLRISSIESNFGEQVITKHYKYRMPNEPNKSSGIITSAPVYEYLAGLPISQQQINGPKPGYSLFLVRTSNSNAPLATTAGSFVEYEYVKELIEENGNQGETLSHFTTSKEFADNNNFSTVFPFAPYTSYEYKRGQLLDQTSYRKSGGILYPIKKIINTYQLKKFASSPSIKLGCILRALIVHYDSQYNATFSNECVSCAIAPYNIETEFPYLATTIERSYESDTTKYIDKFTKYNYDSDLHFQLSSTSTVNSIGDTLITKLSYPLDYISGHSDNESLVINKMNRDFRVSSPIETVQLIKTLAGTFVLGSSLNLYQMTINPITIDTLIVPYKVIQANIFSPLPFSSFVSYRPYLAKDPHYQTRLIYNEYDSKGNVLKVTSDSTKITSYLWGYNNQYPIAMAQHASPNEFYYNNFEESSGSGFVTGEAHTGNIYTTNPNVSWTKPNTRNYVISYWYLSNGKWRYSPERPYTGNNFVLTGGSAYDDVLIKPDDAQVATYTYNPMIGMSSQIDVKGMTTYYTYDNFQRLEIIKDQNGDIIKHIVYKYGSGVNASPEWINTAIKRCVLNQNGTYTGEEMQQQRDNNPNSLTYNTTREVSLGVTNSCQNIIYAKIFYENQVSTLRRVKADVVVRFYSDPDCLNAISVNGLTVLYSKDDGTSNILNSSVLASGYACTIATQATIQENDPSGNPVSYSYFNLRTSNAYNIVIY